MAGAKPERGRGRSPKKPSVADTEAGELIAQMSQDVETIRAFLASALDASRGEATTAKKVARLRLMSDDLASARKFANKLAPE